MQACVWSKILYITVGEDNLKSIYTGVQNKWTDKLTCEGVQSIVRLAKIKSISRITLQLIISRVCTELKIESKKICYGIGELFAPPIKYILENTELTDREIAGVIVGIKCLNRKEIEQSKAFTWKIDLPLYRRQLVPSIDTSRNTWNETFDQTTTDASASSFKFVHLTDLHLDLEYAAGTTCVCKEPLCCRVDSTPSKSKETFQLPGYWGDVDGQCDVPSSLINETFTHISQIVQADNESIKYVIYSGNSFLCFDNI